jgi:hypothetical protein
MSMVDLHFSKTPDDAITSGEILGEDWKLQPVRRQSAPAPARETSYFALQGLQAFLAAQGLQAFFAAQGFLAAHGLHAFLAAQGFFPAQGLALQAASWMRVSAACAVAAGRTAALDIATAAPRATAVRVNRVFLVFGMSCFS